MSKKQEQSNAYMAEARKMAAYSDRIRKAAKAEEKRIKQEDPQFSDEYNIVNNITCRKKLPKGYYKKIIDKIITYLLKEGGSKRTQKDITQDVSNDFPEFGNISENIWQKDLQKWEIDQITDKLNGNMKRPLNIKGCKKLSDIKKRLNSYLYAKDTNLVLKPVMAIGKDAVLVGKSNYPITNRKSGNYEYPSIRIDVDGKRVWQRVDCLLSLFEKKEI